MIFVYNVSYFERKSIDSEIQIYKPLGRGSWNCNRHIMRVSNMRLGWFLVDFFLRFVFKLYSISHYFEISIGKSRIKCKYSNWCMYTLWYLMSLYVSLIDLCICRVIKFSIFFILTIKQWIDLKYTSYKPKSERL